jgi:L-arabonate dehydrase
MGYAGGLPVVLRSLGENGFLHKDALTANGNSIWENVCDTKCWNEEVITPFEAPFKRESGIAVLRGNLAPNGAVIKPSAASPDLLSHTGRAVVFESPEEMPAAIDDDGLDIDETCVMVLKNCGPRKPYQTCEHRRFEPYRAGPCAAVSPVSADCRLQPCPDVGRDNH